jgi:hypothetical protein
MGEMTYKFEVRIKGILIAIVESRGFDSSEAAQWAHDNVALNIVTPPPSIVPNIVL